MRISVVRTGGLAGMRRSATVDTDALDPARAAQLRGLLETADLGKPLPTSPGETRGADRFRYTLTVEEKGRERTLRFAEEDAPESVQRLLEALWRESDALPEPPGLGRA